MNNVKRIFAAMTAAASIGVLSMAAFSASAEEPAVTTTVTEATTLEGGTGESTDTTTTDVSGESSDSSTTETTTTTAPSIKFNTNLIVYANDKEEKGETVLVEKNGDYTVSYKFASADELESLCLDASFDASEYENVKITVKSVEFGDDDKKDEVKLKKNELAFDTSAVQGHSLVVIMSKALGDDQQLGFEDGASITPEADKSVYVTFTVSGLQEATDSSTTSTTTVTTARVYSYAGNSTRTNTTSTVAQTADAGVVAIVVTGAAAAAAAACAMTARRKRK